MKTLITSFLLFLSVLTAKCATVDTISTFSQAMRKNIKAVVIRPDATKQPPALPVVYLLHGYGGNYGDWVNKVKAVPALADQYGCMIVCPDGGIGSWYWDSPVDSSFRYETYIIKELIPYIDSKYATIKDRKGRAITGLSMGGHGALYLSFRHQDIFGAAGSMSGGVDIRPFPLNWDMAKRLGPYAGQKDSWEEHTVINLVNLLTPGSLNLLIDCGTNDFFFGVNEALHRELQYRNIPHDYTTRPGVHDWEYWKNAVLYQMLFFHQFFTR
ncbi:alpha/beta hydrolase [Flavihumibacter petaseus]|uniref:Putative esterase n=1 Tax=Flavihumibacter petaseus NBRC 106054 TaxID=1220578 RepID=A0A0E9MXP2_9BACT|nr:alpha/beta hydrolase family protein [Flavihumibacter petaseus]GAO41880.1 putative esterase [Flavihumibacter petaseus NBRC 106054]